MSTCITKSLTSNAKRKFVGRTFQREYKSLFARLVFCAKFIKALLLRSYYLLSQIRLQQMQENCIIIKFYFYATFPQN